MKATNLSSFCAHLICCAAVVSGSALAQGTAVSKQLQGCEATDIVSNAAASLVLAGCNSPNGLYFSTDFGTNWTLATGGDYASGAARHVEMNSTTAFAVVSTPGTIQTTTLSSLIAGTPSWDASSLTAVSTFTVDGDVLLWGGQSATITASSTSTFSTLQVTTLPDSASSIDQILVAGTSGYAYARATYSGKSKLYRATYVPASGALGAWSDISSASGIPSGATFGGMAYGNNGKLYVTARGTGLDNKGFVSLDNGGSFAEITAGNFSNDGSFSSDGSVGIFGAYLTNDGGVTFSELYRADASQPNIQNTAVLLDPSNSERALVKTSLGFARTTDLVTNAGNPTWADTNAGLYAANVQDLSQVMATSKDIVLVGLGTGTAYTENFTSSSPTWSLQCPGGACLASKVALRPTDLTQAYAGAYAIYRGSASGGAVTWGGSEFIPSVDSTYPISRLQFIGSSLVASYQQVFGGSGGGLRFYNPDTGSLLGNPLGDIPVSDFIAINSSTIFAAAGYSGATSPASTSRGIYVSRDSGATFTQMSDSVLPSSLLVNYFAYDSTGDVLYAVSANTAATGATGNGTLYILKQATSATAKWKKTGGEFFDADSGSEESFDRVAVDPATRDVYVVAGRRIWKSTDGGENWVAFYTGGNDEQAGALVFDDLLLGSNGGLKQITGAAAKTCSLTISRGKTLKAVYKEKATRRAVASGTARLDYRSGSGKFRKLTQKSLKAKLKGTITATVALAQRNKKFSFRARLIQGGATVCTTKALKYKK